MKKLDMGALNLKISKNQSITLWFYAENTHLKLKWDIPIRITFIDYQMYISYEDPILITT
nr:hypothetical protein [uncultured Emticicia sp.]